MAKRKVLKKVVTRRGDTTTVSFPETGRSYKIISTPDDKTKSVTLTSRGSGSGGVTSTATPTTQQQLVKQIASERKAGTIITQRDIARRTRQIEKQPLTVGLKSAGSREEYRKEIQRITQERRRRYEEARKEQEKSKSSGTGTTQPTQPKGLTQKGEGIYINRKDFRGEVLSPRVTYERGRGMEGSSQVLLTTTQVPVSAPRVTTGGRAEVFETDTTKGLRLTTARGVTEIIGQKPVARQARDITFRDIDPATFLTQFVSKSVTKPGKVTPFEYVDIKTRELFRGKVEDPIERKFPESPTAQFLTQDIKGDFSITDVGKFVFFQPAMLTSTETLASLTRRGAITPQTKTKFRAEVKVAGRGADVKVITRTKLGGQEIFGASRQVVKDTTKGSRIVGGRGVLIEKLGVGKTKFTELKLTGGIKDLGTATRVKKISGLRVSQDIGRGAYSKAFTKFTKEAIRREGIRIGVPKVTQQVLKQSFKSQQLTGTIVTGKSGDIVGFVGQTGKITTRISKEGIVRKITEPNVIGVIQTKVGSLPSVVRTFTTIGKRTGAITPNILTRQSAQLSGQTSAFAQSIQSQSLASQLASKQVVKVGQGVAITQATALTGTAEASLIKSAGAIPTIPKLLVIPKLTTKTTQDFSVSFKPRLDTITTTDITTKQKEVEVVKELVDTRHGTSQRQLPRQIVIVPPVQQQIVVPARPIVPFIPTPPEVPPKIPIFAPPYRLRNQPAPKGFGLFGVSIRRYGKFRSIGSGLSLSRAISIGKQRVATTLGATFRIEGQGDIKTPKGFYKKVSKKGILFIEEPKYRLSTVGEIGEIKIAKKVKGVKIKR